MKSLILMRHAKTEAPEHHLEDFDRSLTERGRKNAPEAARVLNAMPWSPDLILSSTARRTRQTTELMVHHLDQSGDIRFEDELYLPHPNTLHQYITSQSSDIDRLLVIVHEPSISSLLAHWTGRYLRVVTASLSRMEFDCTSWDNINAKNLKSLTLYDRHNWQGTEIELL